MNEPQKSCFFFWFCFVLFNEFCRTFFGGVFSLWFKTKTRTVGADDKNKNQVNSIFLFVTCIYSVAIRFLSLFCWIEIDFFLANKNQDCPEAILFHSCECCWFEVDLEILVKLLVKYGRLDVRVFYGIYKKKV